jgi:hypothetical protein
MPSMTLISFFFAIERRADDHHGAYFAGSCRQNHSSYDKADLIIEAMYSRWLISLVGVAILRNGASFSVGQFVNLRTTIHPTRTALAVSPLNDDDSCSNNNSNATTSAISIDSTTAATLRSTLRNLAQLSLADYNWRSSLFKSTQADRMIETSIARLRGEDPSYVRPMDATMPGPLGRLEKAAVDWLSHVIDEEGRRAQAIVDQDGNLVRPMYVTSTMDSLGPLGRIEKAVVDFIHRIRNSEQERVKAGVWRPKDVDDNARGPLGDMEEEAVRILDEINQSERLRAEQSKRRGGEMVRPIDVPGPLGEFEMKVSEIFQAEKLRSQEKQWTNGEVVRPKDAKVRGPLGEAEQLAYEAIKELNAEEMQRLQSIQRVLQENRPMESNRNSLLGMLETVVVGLISGPRLLMSVIARVQELLQSETLDLPDTTRMKTETRSIKDDDERL